MGCIHYFTPKYDARNEKNRPLERFPGELPKIKLQNSLFQEVHFNNGKFTRSRFTYENGKIKRIIFDNKKTELYYGSLGRLSKLISYDYAKKSSAIVELAYDRNGNVISKNATKFNCQGKIELVQSTILEWNKDLLVKNGDIEYYYDPSGTILSKSDKNGLVKKYGVDKKKITAEEWFDHCKPYKSFRYIYNFKGITCLTIGRKIFYLLKDGMGNVYEIFNKKRLIGEYHYDILGNCKVVPKENLDNDDLFAVKNNPIRWNGYYYDTDTKCYYIAGRWYDPQIIMFLDSKRDE